MNTIGYIITPQGTVSPQNPKFNILTVTIFVVTKAIQKIVINMIFFSI